MKRSVLIIAAVAAIIACSSFKIKGNSRQVVYKTTIDCPNCVKKVVENVSFEKGVKDLSTNLDERTVTIVYNPSKTDTLKLADAIRKLGYKAKVLEDKSLQ